MKTIIVVVAIVSIFLLGGGAPSLAQSVADEVELFEAAFQPDTMLTDKSG